MTKVTGAWRTNPATQSVCESLSRDGAQALFVGGCVRNALLGVDVGDIDIATDARPEKVMAMAQDAGIRAVPTGLDHGTVTLVAGGIPHEVTTFRRDVETDGRRAIVAYSDRVEEDAARRDFTMNALYAKADGTLIDPLNGLPDLRARHVRFIGEATARIREDYLRSLRYFRFHAWYGDPARGLDAHALAAISSNLDGMAYVSRERIGAEVLKLLAAPDPGPAVAGMSSAGLLATILPGAESRALAPLVHLEAKFDTPPNPLRRLAALGGGETSDDMRLSRAQAAEIERLRKNTQTMTPAAELGYRLNFEAARDVLLLRSALTGQPLDQQEIDAARHGAQASFPVSAKDLMPKFEGPALGEKLADLEKRWIESGFSLSRMALLDM